MNGTFTIAKREIRSYFNSPLAYIFIVAFLVTCALLFFFVERFFAAGQASLRGYFALMPMVFAILVPALTMRLWAEERRQGTYELLLTMPFRDVELVAGKYLAAMSVVGIALLASFSVPLMVSLFGRFDFGTIVSEYIGTMLMASAAVAIGQAISGASRNQMSAFLTTVLLLLVLSLLSQANAWVELPTWLANAINWVSLSYHFQSFAKGVIDTRDALYFILLTVASLYLTTRFISIGKWR
jgi:ABC-2 type transport system permease protein